MTTEQRHRTDQVVDWTDLGREMWSFLTGREAAINYRFIDMAVEVPRDTGAEAPRATWKLNGTLQVTTQDNAEPRADDGSPADAGPSSTVDADLQFSRRRPRRPHCDRAPDRLRDRAGAQRQRPVRLRRTRRLARGPRHRRRRSPSGVCRVTVVAPTGPLVTLGAPRTPWWQRRVTGSRHIRIERGAGLWSLARGSAQASGAGALPAADLAPPATRVAARADLPAPPPAPVTTTHDPSGGGNPRLIMAPRPDPRPGDRPAGFRLRDDGHHHRQRRRLRHPCCPGLEPLHAEVRHDDHDEFVLVRRGRPRRRPGQRRRRSTRALLRTASRLQLGEWTMSFYREEYADHGRPYGGRVGGEIGHQRPQPSRGARRTSTENE